MDASQLPKGQSSEVSRKRNEPGTYKHEAADKVVYTQAGAEGVIQADALVRVGYKRVGEVPTRVELKAMQDAQLEKDLLEEARAKKALEDKQAKILAQVK